MKWEEKFLQRVEKTSDSYIDVKEIEIGRVISIDPLQIISENLVLFKENLYINPNLLAHTREFEVLTGTVGDEAMTISNGSVSFKACLEDKDLVALRPIGKNKYLLICKVVSQ